MHLFFQALTANVSGRLIYFNETAVDPAPEVVDEPISDNGLRKRRGNDVSFDSSEREAKRFRQEHVESHGDNLTRGRSICRNATRRFSRAKSLITRKHSRINRPQPIVLTPPASTARESARNISQGTKSCGNADDEDSLEDHSNIFMASTTTVAPSDDESKSVWPPLLRKLTGRSASGGRSPSPAFRAFVSPDTPTRAWSRGHVVKGAASVPILSGHRSLSPTPMVTRSQTAPHVSSRGPSGIKRNQKVTVYSYYDEEHISTAAGSARKKQKNN